MINFFVSGPKGRRGQRRECTKDPALLVAVEGQTDVSAAETLRQGSRDVTELRHTQKGDLHKNLQETNDVFGRKMVLYIPAHKTTLNICDSPPSIVKSP